MNKKVAKVAKAVKETIFQVAFIHLLILIFVSIRDSDFSHLNIANILDIQLIVPGYTQTPQNTLFLTSIVALIFIVNIIKSKTIDKSTSKE